jgi:hypothetical protein
MKTKWYVDAELGRYEMNYFYSCLAEVCRDFGIPILKRTGHVEGDAYHHKSEFFFPDNVDEEMFDVRLEELLTSAEYGYEEE